MTIEEIKQKYGDPKRDYYVTCMRCPLNNRDECEHCEDGYESAWKAIYKFMNKPIEHDGCNECKYFDCNEEDEPCIRCKGTSLIGSKEYYSRPDLYKPEGVKEDMVDHPAHYNQGAMETIDEMIILFGVEAVKHFCICNAWKYRARAAYKGDPMEDMHKSDWYIAKYKELGGVSNEFYNKLP